MTRFVSPSPVRRVPGSSFNGPGDRSCHVRNPARKAFLDELQSLAKRALASNTPLQTEEVARQSMAPDDEVGAFSDWCGTSRTIEGSAQNVAITIEIGPQVSLYAFNDWTLAMVVGTAANFFSRRSRNTPPPGLSETVAEALETLRLGERVRPGGRMGEVAGSGVLDLSRLFGKSDAGNRQFQQSPRFVARIEGLAVWNKK